MTDVFNMTGKYLAHFTYEPDQLRKDTIEYEIYIVKYYQSEDDSFNFMIFREREFAEDYAHWVRTELGFHEVILEEGYAPALVDPCNLEEFRSYLDRKYKKSLKE